MPDPLIHLFPSPLRYPGGKGDIANFVKLLFLRNGLVGHHYVELYAGGASVALSLLYEEYAAEIHINDLNRSVHAFWNAVLNQTEDLCRLIADSPVTMENWHRQKAVQSAEDPEPLDLAFSTFFLNRTNRSGIIGGGVIGGKQQLGKYKLDARYNREDLIRRIRKVARYRGRITLTQRDAAHYLRRDLQALPHSTFLYLDPPYYVKGAGLYEDSYTDDDHAAVAELIRPVDRPWIVSYDAAPRVLEVYEGFRDIRYHLSYSAGDRYRGCEVMFFSPRLTIPEVGSPANIVPRRVAEERLAALALSWATPGSNDGTAASDVRRG